MKSPRDRHDKDRVVVGVGHTLWVGKEEIELYDHKQRVSLPRKSFDALVDWYIGADAIRKVLKAKDEEIRDLRHLYGFRDL